VPLSAAELEQFILPHLALLKRDPHCKLGYHKLFHSILKVLYTGMQWKALPIDKNPDNRPEIHYSDIFKLFARIFYSDPDFQDLIFQPVKVICAAADSCV
jgi:hypothetical protein